MSIWTNKFQLWIQRLVEEEDSMSNDREILRATGRVTTRTGFTNDGTQTSSPAGLASESSMKVMERQSDVSFFLQLVRAQSKTLVTMNAAERTTRCGFWWKQIRQIWTMTFTLSLTHLNTVSAHKLSLRRWKDKNLFFSFRGVWACVLMDIHVRLSVVSFWFLIYIVVSQTEENEYV